VSRQEVKVGTQAQHSDCRELRMKKSEFFIAEAVGIKSMKTTKGEVFQEISTKIFISFPLDC
jgi:hypothetical protein